MQLQLTTLQQSVALLGGNLQGRLSLAQVRMVCACVCARGAGGGGVEQQLWWLAELNNQTTVQALPITS